MMSSPVAQADCALCDRSNKQNNRVQTCRRHQPLVDMLVRGLRMNALLKRGAQTDKTECYQKHL